MKDLFQQANISSNLPFQDIKETSCLSGSVEKGREGRDTWKKHHNLKRGRKKKRERKERETLYG